MRIFDYTDYRLFLRDTVNARRRYDSSVNFAALARAIRVQRSYLSHVIHGRANLDADQLYLLGETLNLDADEKDYLLLLLEIDRCQVRPRLKTLEKRRDDLRFGKASTERYTPSSTSCADLSRYFSDPDYSVVRLYLAIEHLKACPEGIASASGIPRGKVARIIAEIGRLQSPVQVAAGGGALSGAFQLDTTTPASLTIGNAFRLRGMVKRQSNANEEDYFFTGSFVTSREVYSAIRRELLLLLERAARKIQSSGAEEVFHINLDLFSL